MQTVIVLAGGSGRCAPAALPPGATVIAADSGADFAVELGLRTDLLVGDLDSVSPQTLTALEQSGTRIERHPRAKDQTDLELALTAALALAPERILVLGGIVGRVDHLLGELLLFAADEYAGVVVDAQLGPAAVHVIREERVLAGVPGELISLFAAHGPATGIVTAGLLYPLRRETLEPGSTRGLSNVFAGPQAGITLERGVLLAVRPTYIAAAGS